VRSIDGICRTLSSVLTQAVEDELLTGNPASRLGRYYRKRDAQKIEVCPLTREEAARLLEAAQKHAARHYALFLCALRTGMRLGELLALEWSDVDIPGRSIEVRRNRVAGEVTTPKNGKIRRIDMSDKLAEALEALQKERAAEKLAAGWKEMPATVFCTPEGTPLDGDNLRNRVFYQVLKKAKMRHIRFHDLRHTFASLLIQQGASLAYVRDQCGHSSIQVTVDIYGHLVPGANRAEVNKLDIAPTQESSGANEPETEPDRSAA
jgi:integrase